MMRGAVLSDCGQYRYHLLRKWDEGRSLVFVMLNPSTADAEKDDPTIRRCIAFAETLGYGAIEVINLYAYRATKPAVVTAAASVSLDALDALAAGPDNDDMLAKVAEGAMLGACDVCAAWGAMAAKLSRAEHVERFFRNVGVTLLCLETTQDGHPAHPLYLPGALHLRPLRKPSPTASGNPATARSDGEKP